jgi:hypothetical protein
LTGKHEVAEQESELKAPDRWIFIRNVLLKALVLFVILNLVFLVWYPLPSLGQLTAYNSLFPGRKRLPYGENPTKAYNLSLFNLEAMFNSHELTAGVKPPDEFRVIFIGDSATWGFLLGPDETVTAHINASATRTPDGRQLRAYNLGYPVMSATKDLLILSMALEHEPDLIVWPITLESFPLDKQLFPPLLQHNPKPVRALIAAHELNLDPNAPEFIKPTVRDRTIIGARRSLADLIRLQLYGVMWAATGIDQYIPETYTARMEDLPADESFHNLEPPHLKSSDLALDTLSAGIRMAGDTPVLIINEPMFISRGENSDIRYNFYYPRWAYDAYRELLYEQSAAEGWYYFDLWDTIPNTEFTNSAVHLSPEGGAILAQKISQIILDILQYPIKEQ